MNKSDLIAIRSVRPEDMNFIYASWLRGLYYGDSVFSLVPKQIFMSNYHKVLDFLLKSNNTEITVACLKDDPEVILGYAVLSKNPRTLHYVFVKKQWRSIGIAKGLIPGDINVATHFTKVGFSIMNKKGWTYNPFIS